MILYDSVDLSQIPPFAQAVGAYVDGRWANSAEAATRFPRARILTIAVSAAHDAMCLDVETGDATPGQAADWYTRQKARGVARPCLYASVSVMQAGILPALKTAGIARSSVRLWSAHYTMSAHRCGPAPSCGELSISADGTQWTDQAMGRNLDQSLLAADFFDVTASANWQEAMLNALPVVKPGDTGQAVRTVQGLCVARGHQVTVDGSFGPATAAAVAAVQHDHGVTPDHVVGNVTWAVLVTGSVP